MAYAHLTGDLDANPSLLAALDRLAKQLGKVFTVTSGRRTYAEQADLYAHPQGYPVAKPGTSRHETGNAADVIVDGKPIQEAIPAAVLRAAGLSPLAGDAVHVELPGSKPVGGGGVSVGGIAGTVGGLLPGIGPFAQTANAVGGVPGNVVSDAANDAAKATAKALVGVLVDAIGADGARLLLSVALVAAAVALIGFGGARALGLRTPPLPLPPALAAARAIAK